MRASGYDRYPSLRLLESLKHQCLEVQTLEARWKTALILSGIFLLGSLLLGFLVQDWHDFTENILAEIAGFCLAFGVAVWLIEGRAASWEKRRQQFITKQAKAVLRMSQQYSSLLVTDVASLLSFELKLYANVHSVKARDVVEFKRLATKIFDQACCVPENGLPSDSDFNEEVFGRVIDSIEKFSHSVHESYRGDYDVQTYLSELTVALDDLNGQIAISRTYQHKSAEKIRFKSTGEIGRKLLEFEEAIAKDCSAFQ